MKSHLSGDKRHKKTLNGYGTQLEAVVFCIPETAKKKRRGGQSRKHTHSKKRKAFRPKFTGRKKTETKYTAHFAILGNATVRLRPPPTRFPCFLTFFPPEGGIHKL